MLIGNFFKHLLNDRRSFPIYNDMTFTIAAFFIQISKWGNAWPQSHLTSCPKSPFYVNAPIKKDIAKILSQYGFTVNHKKCKLLKKGGVQYVTGLTVSDDIPRIPRKFKRSIRLEIYYMKKYGKFGHLFYHIVKNSEPKIFFNKIKEFGIDGLIAFINSVEPKFAKFIRKELSKCKHITKRNNIQLTDKN